MNIYVLIIFCAVFLAIPVLMAMFFQSGSMGKTAINVQKKILDENEETLKEIANKKASINKEAIKTVARSVKDGMSEEEMYCKHCGASIDSDSKFCKKCGKEQ